MKKLLSVVLSMSLLFAFSVTSYAAEPDSAITKIVSENGYSFEISETTNEFYRTTRTYERNPNQTRSVSIDIEETKALLIALGMNEDSVDKLSSNSLQNFASGSSISISTSFSKYDRDGNAVYVSEEEALSEAEHIKEQRLKNFISTASRVSPMASPDYEGNYTDSYMELTYAVTELSTASDPGRYYFVTDATWLTMPFWRGFDSIGACSMNCTVNNSTRSGWYEYDMVLISGGYISYSDGGGDIKSVKNAVNGNWYGSAGIINLPSDFYDEYSSFMYENYTTHYEFEGHVVSPDESRWFNSIGSYDHSTIAVAIDPSLSIDLGSGDVSASIGLSITGDTDTRSVEHEVFYRA